MTDLSLTVSRTINAPVEAVFDAWLNPRILPMFMLPGDAMRVPRADVDPREGGRFDIVMAAGDKEMPHGGTFLEINPHSRIVFTWESPFSIEGSTVTLDLKKTAGGTEITLTHVKFPDEESRANHEAGWGRILDTLSGALG